MEDAEVVLRRAPLFEGLDEDSARALRRQMADVKLSRGEHLFLEGQEGDRLYVVLDGKIKLTRAAADGRENLISVLGPGEMFGELSLFDPRPRTSTASAVTDVTVAALAHDALRPWLLERAGSLAASAARQEAVLAGGRVDVTPYPVDDPRALTGAAARLSAQFAGQPAALRALGLTSVAGGRNDATVAAFLNLRIGPLDARLEQYASKLSAAQPNELAMSVAGVQHYSELIHKALLLNGPPQLVVVSLQQQQLTAYDHGRAVLETLVTTGRAALPTDVGPMHIWRKDAPWTMKSPWPKGSPNWYPDTQVQMVAWFSTTGEGLHDASWQPAGTYGPGSQNGPYASHGCIHVPPAAETTLFSWATIGTPVVVIPGDGSSLDAQVAQQSVDAMGNPITGARGD